MRSDRKAWARERLAFGLITLLLHFSVSTSLGFVYTRVGVVSAVASHFVYGVIMLQGLSTTPQDARARR